MTILKKLLSPYIQALHITMQPPVDNIDHSIKMIGLSITCFIIEFLFSIIIIQSRNFSDAEFYQSAKISKEMAYILLGYKFLVDFWFIELVYIFLKNYIKLKFPKPQNDTLFMGLTDQSTSYNATVTSNFDGSYNLNISQNNFSNSLAGLVGIIIDILIWFYCNFLLIPLFITYIFYFILFGGGIRRLVQYIRILK